MMKYFSNLVYLLLKIGSNTQRKEKWFNGWNIIKITIYYLQLIGYIYNQFETKNLYYQENVYLAKITQYSSFLFVIVLNRYDPVTLFIYYGIFITLCLGYLIIILQLITELKCSLNKSIKFFFENFLWCFFTPLLECMIGMMTCGRLAYLEKHSKIQGDCLSQISPEYIVIGLIGLLLVMITSFISLYCFRNYQFISADLMFKFSKLNLINIFLLIGLKILQFLVDYELSRHLIFIVILLIIGLDVQQKLPFGFVFESVYYIYCLVCTAYFEILLIIWHLTDYDDSIIFMSFFISIPLLYGVTEASFNSYTSSQLNIFCCGKAGNFCEFQLEYLCALGHSFKQNECFLMLHYLKLHCQMCNDVSCPCNKDIETFISYYCFINQSVLNEWIQYQFQQQIRQPIDYQNIEQLTIKFATFLQKYRGNQVLSYKIIQDVVYKFQVVHMNTVSQFFKSLTRQIQFQNKIEMEQLNRSKIHISQQEFHILQDLNLFYVYEQDIINGLLDEVECQKRLWIAVAYNQISYNELLELTQQIEEKAHKILQIFQQFFNEREKPIVDSLLISRIQLLIALICMQDLNAVLRIVAKIHKLEKDQHSLKRSVFTSNQFMNGQGLSILSRVSTQTFGCINQQINDQFCNFFGYETAEFSTIEQLLPVQIGKIHNGLIENFLQRGQSARLYTSSEQFILNKENLIEKVNICLTTIYPHQNEAYTFVIVGHMLKVMKYQKGNVDFNKKGYILVDSEFAVFGLTKNVYERINYKYFYKNQDKSEIIQPSSIYGYYTIQQLIPQLQMIFEEYYKIQSLQHQNAELKLDIICQRESGVLIVPKGNQAFRMKKPEPSQKFLNEDMIHVLHKLRQQPRGLQEAFKQYPIEFTVTQKVLKPMVENTFSEFIYFVVEVDFMNEIKFATSPTQGFAKTPTLSEMIRRQQSQMELVRSPQSQVVFSNDEDDKIELFAETTNAGTKQSSGEITEYIEKVGMCINTHVTPLAIQKMIAQFILQFLLVIGIVIALSQLFQYKKDIQSGCLFQNTQDLNFLDAYSEVQCGSRHVIYYRDFYSLQTVTLININNSILNISRYDKIYMGWQHIQKGSIRLINMYANYSKIVEQNTLTGLTFKFISTDLKSQIVQPVGSYATYYQIMFYLFYFSYQSFATTPAVYLSGRNDTYATQIVRSQSYYNFFDVITSVNSSLSDCRTNSMVMNDTFDNMTLYYFLAIYFVLLIELTIIIYFYLRLVKQIKHYLKLFKICDKHDCQSAIKQCEQYLNMVKYDRIFLRANDFKVILNQPYVILKNLKKPPKSIEIVVKRKKMQQSKQTLQFIWPIVMFVLMSLCLFLYVIAFQIFYQDLKLNISPISDRAMQAQQMRLNFIVSANRFDLYIVKQYFEAYSTLNGSDENHSFMSRNIITDGLILDLLDIDSNIISNDIERLSSINFADLLLQEYSVSETIKEGLLGGDVCTLTGCNMQEQLFFDRLHQDQIVPLFYSGIINLYQKVLTLIKGGNELIVDDPLQRAYALESIFNSTDYLIYMLWGLDAIQFQIQQFSQYFIDISQNTLNSLTQYNSEIICLVGLVFLVSLLLIHFLFIFFFTRKYQLSKALIKYIPLPILFQRNILKHLILFQKKYKD